MDDFKELLLLDEDAFAQKMAEIDSGDLVCYLKNCNDLNIKDEYYKRINKILGVDYGTLLKSAVN